LEKRQSLFQAFILTGYAGYGRSDLPGGLLSSRRDGSVGQLPIEIGMLAVMLHRAIDADDQSFFRREGQCLCRRPIMMMVAMLGRPMMVMMALLFAIVLAHLNTSFLRRSFLISRMIRLLPTTPRGRGGLFSQCRLWPVSDPLSNWKQGMQ
jgi:hypothetical protein